MQSSYPQQDLSGQLPLGTTIPCKSRTYQVLNVLGRGAYGTVYEGAILEGNKEVGRVAIKQSLLHSQIEGIPATALREISLLRQVEHDNIVKLKGVQILKNVLFLIFELQRGDLKYLIDSVEGHGLPPQRIKMLIGEILRAVQMCHSRRIIHRDIKPGNILISEQGTAKLADFGLARPFTYPLKPLSQEVVTLWYKSPELLVGIKTYGPPVDVWSVGCIFAELVFGHPLFPGSSMGDQLSKVLGMLGQPSEEEWPQFYQYHSVSMNEQNPESMMQEQNLYCPQHFSSMLSSSGLDLEGRDLLMVLIYLMQRMLALNPARRISASDCLKHNYFK